MAENGPLAHALPRCGATTWCRGCTWPRLSMLATVDAAGFPPQATRRARRSACQREAAPHPLQQVGAIGVVVASHVVFVQPVQAASQARSNSRSSASRWRQSARPWRGGCCRAGVVEVREVELARPFAHQRQQRAGQVVGVHGRHGEARKPTFDVARHREGTAARLRSNAPSRRRICRAGFDAVRLMPT